MDPVNKAPKEENIDPRDDVTEDYVETPYERDNGEEYDSTGECESQNSMDQPGAIDTELEKAEYGRPQAAFYCPPRQHTNSETETLYSFHQQRQPLGDSVAITYLPSHPQSLDTASTVTISEVAARQSSAGKYDSPIITPPPVFARPLPQRYVPTSGPMRHHPQPQQIQPQAGRAPHRSLGPPQDPTHPKFYMETFKITSMTPFPQPKFVNVDISSKCPNPLSRRSKEALPAEVNGASSTDPASVVHPLQATASTSDAGRRIPIYMFLPPPTACKVEDNDDDEETLLMEDCTAQAPEKHLAKKRAPKQLLPHKIAEKVLDIDYRPVTKIKRPINAFMAFMSHMREILKREGTPFDNKEFIREMSYKWKEASNDFQKFYWDLAHKLTKSRNDEMTVVRRRNAVLNRPVQLNEVHLCADTPNTFVWTPAEQRSLFENIDVPPTDLGLKPKD